MHLIVNLKGEARDMCILFSLQFIYRMGLGRYSKTDINSSHPSVAANFCETRLGNQMSVFASQYSLSKEFGILNYFTDDQLAKLNAIFDIPKPNSSADDWPYYLWDNGGFS